MRILVVDDSPTMRRIVRIHLRALGLDAVVEADSGEAALARIRAGEADAVVADWAMPGMTGVELVRAIRGHAGTRDIPVLMVTGMGQQEDIEEAADAGVDGYVVKPFDVDTLRTRLQQALAHRASVRVGTR
jgi:two-component system chemotaxis response regulator CheY